MVSRLPQLLSPNLLADGDECVLGLMAKHLAQGKEFPIFFYGQHYGLSSVEAAAGAAAFLIFGTGALPLKLSMLAVWTIGVLFLFLALSRLLGNRGSFWITAALHPQSCLGRLVDEGEGRVSHVVHGDSGVGVAARAGPEARHRRAMADRGRTDRRDLSRATALAARRAAAPGDRPRLTPAPVVGSHVSRRRGSGNP